MLTAKAGFRIYVALILSHCAPILGQQEDPLGAYKWKDIPNQSTKDRLVFYYFGASDCAPCVQAENVKAIRMAKEQAARKHPHERKPRVDIRAALPALIKATEDSDMEVRAWAAHSLAEMGPDAKKAIPALLRLLKDSEEGPRNTSCIA